MLVTGAVASVASTINSSVTTSSINFATTSINAISAINLSYSCYATTNPSNSIIATA